MGTVTHRRLPTPVKIASADCPAPIEWTPVAAPVEMYSPARSGRPRRALQRSAKARAASGPPLTAAALPRPDHLAVDAGFAIQDSRLRVCQSATSAPSSRPALLPKSLATTAGPKSLMLTQRTAGDLDADVHRLDEAPRGFGCPLGDVGRRILGSCTTNSASIAANPSANTGTSTAATPLARLTPRAENRAHEALRAVFLAERFGDPADFPAGDGIVPKRYGLVLASIGRVEVLGLGAGILRERAGGTARLDEFGGHPFGVEREVGDNGNQFMNLLYSAFGCRRVLYRETGVIFNGSRGHFMSNRLLVIGCLLLAQMALAAETPLAFPGRWAPRRPLPGGGAAKSYGLRRSPRQGRVRSSRR